MRTVLTRLAGFALFPLLSLVTPLLLLPVIAHLVGEAGVSSVVSGQSVGAFAATAITWGWGFEGPVAVATASNQAERGALYARSLRHRLLLSLIVLPVAGLIAAAVATPGFAVEAVAMTIVNGVTGLSPAWFCIGMGTPKLLAAYDTLPRFLAALAAVPAVIWAGQLWPYLALTVMATLISLVAFHRRFATGHPWVPRITGPELRGIWAQRHAAGISMAGNAYASTPTPIATATTAPRVSAPLAAGDTLYRFSLAAVIALGNAFQSWVLDPGAARPRYRQLAAMAAHLAVGILGLLAFVLLAPWATSLLFAGKVQATQEIAFYYGLAFLFICLGTPLMRNLLLPARRQGTILVWTLISAVVGLGVMFWAGLNGDAAKIALGMALSEAILCLGLLGPALIILKNGGPSHE